MRTRPYARRGLTLLESILAVALLALVATSIATVMGYVSGAQRRAHVELAAAEVANRLIIQYLDDKQTLFDQGGKPIPYGPADDTLYFRWDLREGGVRLDVSEASVGALESSNSQLGRVDTVRQVTAWVWLSEDSGGSFERTDETPTHVLTRVYAPIFGITFRGADTMAKLTDDPRNLEAFISAVMSVQEGAGWQTNSIQQGAGGATNREDRPGRLGRGP
ncbi:MAG: prepilin-type N-terminal cleavage/methylation domain-containing protein [Planctomycetota bacterium]